MPRFTTSDKLSLYFEDTGTGSPVLCLPGLTRNCRDFDFLAPHLSSHRMIAMDYRGRGQSDYDPTYANYTVPREAQDVIELLDHLDLPRVALIGTSRGGLISMALAAAQPDRIRAVVLNDVGPVVDADGIARIVAYLGQPPVATDLASAAEMLETLMGPQFPGVPHGRWRAVAGAIYSETATGLALRYDAHLADALSEQLKAGPPPDLWPLFDALKGIPLGVVRGARYDILTAETLSAMAARHPDLIAATIADRGHAPFLDEPEAVQLIHTVLETQ